MATDPVKADGAVVAKLGRALGAASAAGGRCLGETAWEELAAGALPWPEREAALQHASGCPRCAEVWRALAEVAREAARFDPAVPQLPPLTLPGRRRWAGRTAGVAAGLLAAGLLVVLLRPTREPQVIRAQATAPAIELVEPGPGEQARPARLRWKAPAGLQCSPKLRAADGALLFSGPATDRGEAELPASVALGSGRVYWQVECGAGGSSALGSFTVR